MTIQVPSSASFQCHIYIKSSIQYKFDRDTALFDIHINIDKALKLQILASIDGINTQALREKYVAYGNLFRLGMITRLKSN